MMGGNEFNRDVRHILWTIAGWSIYIILFGLLALKVWNNIK